MDFLKKKPEIKKRTLNYNFNESRLDEYSDIHIKAFVQEYYKDAKVINQSTAYMVPNTSAFHPSLKINRVVSVDRIDQEVNISICGLGVWNSDGKRVLAKIIE